MTQLQLEAAQKEMRQRLTSLRIARRVRKKALRNTRSYKKLKAQERDLRTSTRDAWKEMLGSLRENNKLIREVSAILKGQRETHVQKSTYFLQGLALGKELAQNEAKERQL